jgi:hypothetical protein
MSEIVTVITQISVVVFVVTSMLAMGLSLTIPQIIQPLKKPFWSFYFGSQLCTGACFSL